MLGGGVQGYGIVQNIGDACRYLMRVHEAGDKLFLFGFSRGEFTAQTLPDDNMAMIDDMIELRVGSRAPEQAEQEPDVAHGARRGPLAYLKRWLVGT